MLSDSESDVESLHRLTINEHYAKAFEYKKEREELQKLKEKYGSDYEEGDEESETDSEEAESEDEDGEELTPAVDAAILRTLARIKRKDPDIYNADKGIFEEEQEKTGSMKVTARAPKDKSKPVTIRQVALESALNAESRSPSPEVVTHVEEQRALRNETIAAFHSGVGNDDDDGLLVPREKTKDEMEREEEEYREFLQREVGGDLADLVTVEAGSMDPEEEDSTAKKKKKKKKVSKEGGGLKSKEETDQEFLMNYILNRGWIDRSTRHIPTYNEITVSKKGKSKAEAPLSDDVGSGSDSEGADETDDQDGELDEDEFDDIVDRFESSYNFRFEEPDAAVIKSYPRNLPSLVRREDTTRKDARERKKQRKEEELAKKKEEVKRLKVLKMKEIRNKLERIGREGGKNIDEDEALRDLDLEGDWDPEAHDRQMAGLYGDDADITDDEKPQWEDDIDIGDIVIDEDVDEDMNATAKPKKKKKKKAKEQDEQDDGVDVDEMDADVERPVEDDEEWDGTEEMRKRKLDEYMDEIYGLDFNDMVGGMPTRFKYTTVLPQSFALTPAEILMATDAELNQYMGVKRYAPYRKEARWDATRVNRLKELKDKLVERTGKDGQDADGSKKRKDGQKPRKGKKERQMLKAAALSGQGASASVEEADDTGKDIPKKRKLSGDGEKALEAEEGDKRKRRRHKKTAQA